MTQRNKSIGIFSHVDGGKTTLMEAILYKSGVIKQIGNVNKGTTVLDNEPIERRRKITFSSKPVSFEFQGKPYTFIDTPGHMDLTFEMERILQVVDIAVLIISATDGVTGYAETIFDLCEQYGVPILVFVNKTDVDTVDLPTIQQELSNLSSNIVKFDAQSLNANSEFLEEWAMFDDNWLDLMLSEDNLNQEVVKNALNQAIIQNKIIPAIYGSALTFDGLAELLNLLDVINFEPTSDTKPIAQIYKITHDKNNNRQVNAKIISGEFHSKEKVVFRESDQVLKINELFYPEGTKLEKTDSAKEGDIVVMTGLAEGSPGEFLGGQSVEPSELPDNVLMTREPVYEVQVVPVEETQYDDMIKNFHILSNEDPTLRTRYKSEVNELYISIVGVIQMEYLKETFMQRFNIEIEFKTPSILYKETVTQSVIGYGHFEPLRHYAEVALRIEPGEPGQGIVAKNNCPREQLDINFQSRIMTHILEKEHLGVLTGSPLTDVTITLLSGQAYQPETKGGDFREATYRAIRQGLMKVREAGQILEPWYAVKIAIPADLIGKVSSDIIKMGGNIEPISETTNGMTIIEGAVPVSNFTDYPLEFASFTKNKGRLNTTLKGYFPCQNQEAIITGMNYNPESDLENTPNSIFFKKGSGYDAHWTEVEHLHHIVL